MEGAAGRQARVRGVVVAFVTLTITMIVTPAASIEDPAGPVVPLRLVDLLEYRFDGDEVSEELITNVLDTEGWLDGQIVGTPTVVDGSSGQALQFDGVIDHIEVRESRNVSFRHGVYAQARVVLDSATGGRSRGIVTKWYPDQWLLSFNRYLGAHGMLEFTVRLDDGTPTGEYHRIEYALPSPTLLDTWITVTGIYDPHVGVQLFLDGALVAFDPSAVELPIVDAFQPIRIGDSGNDWSRFEGVIDDVVVWGDFSPVPYDAEPLAHYDFDLGQVAYGETDNLVAGPGVAWMRGALLGGATLGPGPTMLPEDRALWLDPVVPPEEPEDELDHVDVVRGHLLTFTHGIAVVARIYLPDELQLSRYPRIAGQLAPAGAGDAFTPWRLYLAPIEGEGFNLMFEMNLEDGRHVLLKFQLPGQDEVPPAYQGRWIDVGASYDPWNGLAALYWDHRRVVVDPDVGPGVIRAGADLRIGLGALLSSVTAFGGLMDEVRIWGDRRCLELTTAVDPPGAGAVTVTPEASRLPFCPGDLRYASGELVHLEATAIEDAWFYAWSGNLVYLEGSSSGMYDIDIALTDNTTATANFRSEASAPEMVLFPVAGCHNTSVDFPSRTIEGLACGRQARALANSACHGAGQDIFAELGTPVVAAQDGHVRFSWDVDKAGNPVGGNAAEIVTDVNDDGSWGIQPFLYYYAHFDTVCLVLEDGTTEIDTLNDARPPREQFDCPSRITVRDLGYYLYGVGEISAGTVLGTVGKSGNADVGYLNTDEHLHFAIGIQNPEELDEWLLSCQQLDPFPILYALEDGSCPDTSFYGDFESGGLGGWTTGGN